MAIDIRSPNTIRLHHGIDDWIVNDIPAGVAITPGMLIERYLDAGVEKWRPATSAAGIQPKVVALEVPGHNLGIDDPYQVGWNVAAWYLRTGYTFYGLLPSGQNIALADYLQSNGDGMLKEATATTAAANVAHFQCIKVGPGAVTTTTRVRVEVIA